MKIPFLAGFAAATLLYLPPLPSAMAAPGAGQPIVVTVTRASGEVLKLRGRERFRAISILPAETVSIRAQLPSQMADIPAFAQPLDGGLVTSELVIASDGNASAVFQAGSQPGRYRLLFRARGRSAVLQFDVVSQ